MRSLASEGGFRVETGEEMESMQEGSEKANLWRSLSALSGAEVPLETCGYIFKVQ